MRILVSLLSGLIFGIGLVISGMANPAKVLNFLDVFGTWDPSLAFVMGGAIAVAMPGFILAGWRERPVFAGRFFLPDRTDIDRDLLLGSGLFGIGWGLIGLCPGPALVSLSGQLSGIWIFVPSMVVGIVAVKFYRSR